MIGRIFDYAVVAGVVFAVLYSLWYAYWPNKWWPYHSYRGRRLP